MQQLHFISTSPFYKDVLENVYKYNVDNDNHETDINIQIGSV